MAPRPRVCISFAVLATALLLSGCAGGPDGVASAGIPSGSPPTGDGAGSAATHGQPTRTESAVTVGREGSQYVARQTVTFANDFGGASSADVRLDTVNGGVSAKAWRGGGYESKVTLSGRAPTEAQAREALARMSVAHTDRLAGDRLALATVVDFPSSFGSQVSGQASIELSAPPQPAYRLDLETVNGGAAASGLGGPSASARTQNGGVDVSGAFNSVTAGTTNGGVELAGRANQVRATTDNGGIAADLAPTSSGSYSFTTLNGAIRVELGGGAAYDVTADALNGGVSVDLDGGEEVGSQSRTHKHVRSADYAASPVQTTVRASTTNGAVSVDG